MDVWGSYWDVFVVRLLFMDFFLSLFDGVIGLDSFGWFGVDDIDYFGIF